MTTLLKSSKMLFLALVFLAAHLAADDTQDLEKQKTESKASTESWLGMLDQGNYSDTWDSGSGLMRNTMSKAEWSQLMSATRGSLGSLQSRTLEQQLPAQDPKGLPKGDYMVMLYKSSFSNKPSVQELITLSYEGGKWKVITYMVD